MIELAELVRQRGGNVKRILDGARAGEVDVHQLNCTYYSALGEADDHYLAARAIQLFARCVPQIYYVGLLAGDNDATAVELTGEGRAINRRDYTQEEVAAALHRPVVRSLLELVRLRDTHPAFEGSLEVETDDKRALRLCWRHERSFCTLDVDLTT